MENSFLYFAYGSGLNPTMVEFRVNDAVKIICKGELKHYALRFNRKNPDGTARGNLHFLDDEFTLGILYQINKNKFEQLKQTEPAYILTEFDILTPNGTLKAFAFICHQCEEGIYPGKKYVEGIIENAHTYLFPSAYIEKIKLQMAK